MIKKLIVVAVIGGLAVAAFKNSRIGSHIRHEIASIREAAESAIPPEKEISRLRSELKNLDQDVMKVVNLLAKERVEVETLKQTVADNRTRQSTTKELLTARANSIKEAEAKTESFVSFGDRKVGLTAAKAELEDGVKRYTSNQKSLETLELTLASRERVRDGLEKQLEALKGQKQELAVAIDALEAELTMLKLQQTESKYQTDGSRLARIKEDMRTLKQKVDIEREKLKLLPAAFDGAATSPTSNKSVDAIMAPVTGNTPATKPADIND